jgi:hypothetical protein
LLSERTKDALFLTALGAALGLAVWIIDARRIPENWSATQSVPGEYEMTVDRKVFRSGRASVHVKSKADDPKGNASLQQEFMPVRCLGRRLRMEAFVKTSISSGAAYLWLEARGSEGKQPLSDKILGRRITGTTDWTRHEITVDVPRESQKIAFGFVLSGKGEVWIDDFRFQVFDGDVPVISPEFPEGPINLGFE